MTRTVMLVSASLLALAAAAPAQAQFVESKRTADGGTQEANWEKGYFQAVGRATARPDPNPVKMRLQATEAARVVAQARLVEMMQGIQLTGGTLVKDAEFGGQTLMNRVRGTLNGAVTVAEEAIAVPAPNVPGGQVYEGVVTLRVCLINRSPECSKFGGGGQGVYQAIDVTQAAPKPKDPLTVDEAKVEAAKAPPPAPATAAPPAPAQAQAPAPAAPLTGLVLTLGGKLDYVPMLAPEVVTDGGKTVYSVTQVQPGAIVANGPMQYVDTIDRAKGMDLIGKNPLVVAVVSVNANNQIVVAAADGARLVAASIDPNNFLSGAKVALAYK